MTSLIRRVVALGMTVGLLTGASEASAEGFLDLYAGKSFTEASTLIIDVTGSPLPSGRVAWDDTIVFGVRSGFFFPGVAKFIGLGLDFSYFQPSPISEIKVHTMPLTPMLLVRIPLLTSKAIPAGRIQPYAAAGPALVVTYVTTDLAPVTAIGFDVGLDVRAGLRIMISKHVGVFGEWRYTDVDVKAEVQEVPGSLSSSFKTNHINGGLTLSF